MNPKFREAIESLHPKFEQLIGSMPYVRGSDLPRKGVYLLSEESKRLYVGRSDDIRRRLYDHRGQSSDTNKASFAALIARKELGWDADYRSGPKTRKNLNKNPIFR